MHNSPLKNAEFKLVFTETNLRFLLGDKVRDEEKINKTKVWIEEAKLEIKKLRTELKLWPYFKYQKIGDSICVVSVEPSLVQV